MISIADVSNLSKERGRARTLLQRSHRIIESEYLRGPPNPQPPALRWAFRSSVCVFPYWWKTSKDLQQIHKKTSCNFRGSYGPVLLIRLVFSTTLLSHVNSYVNLDPLHERKWHSHIFSAFS